MKRKMVGIFICIMILISTCTLIAPAEQQNSNTLAQQPLATSQDDVPVWDIGNQWTYTIDDIDLHFNSTSGIIDMHLSMDRLPLTVNTMDDTTYTAGFTTALSGNAYINMNLGDGPIDMTITFSNLKLQGDMTFEKTTLGITGLTGVFDGRFWVKINEQPYLPLPWLPTLPVKLKVSDFATEFSTSMTPLKFPLNDSMVWNLSSTNVTVDGIAQSPWFYLILLINSFYPILPPEIAGLLPVVDIQDALTTIGIPTPLTLPMIEGAFYCLNTEPVTVPAGTYNAYNISILNGTARCYYAPDVGNIIKLTGNLEELIPFITNINMELESATYP
jgi:hypothetical protein